jgi:hypothetical protein
LSRVWASSWFIRIHRRALIKMQYATQNASMGKRR